MRCVQFASGRLAKRGRHAPLSCCNTHAPTPPPCRRPFMRRQLLQRWRRGAAHGHQFLLGLPGGLLGRGARPRRLPALVRPVTLQGRSAQSADLHEGVQLASAHATAPRGAHVPMNVFRPFSRTSSTPGTYRRYGMVSNQCWSCPPGSFSAAGASACTLCEPGTATAAPETAPDPATGGCPAWWVGSS